MLSCSAAHFCTLSESRGVLDAQHLCRNRPRISQTKFLKKKINKREKENPQSPEKLVQDHISESEAKLEIALELRPAGTNPIKSYRETICLCRGETGPVCFVQPHVLPPATASMDLSCPKPNILALVRVFFCFPKDRPAMFSHRGSFSPGTSA